MNTIINKMKHDDIWCTDDICAVLSEHNDEVGEQCVFRDLLYSAKKSKKIEAINEPMFILEHTSEYRLYNFAENQFNIAYPSADLLRKTCEFDDSLQEKILPTIKAVQCELCTYFTPDTIGDGVGIGHCALNVKFTREVHGKMPLYRYAERHCVQYKQSYE